MRNSLNAAAALALVAGVCVPQAMARTSPNTATARAAKRGLALAQTRCAACHGVTANSSSPNPEAPSWEDIANRPGTTQLTLRRFLRDSHNYPEAMNFHITARRVNDIAQYMITLQRRGYKPSI